MTKKMKKNNNKIMALIVCLLALLPSSMYAQFSFDVTSVEAYINDHKEQRSLLLVRSTLEASNKLLHDYSGDANKPKSVIRISLCRTAKRNPLFFPIWTGMIFVFLMIWLNIKCACLLVSPDRQVSISTRTG